MVAQLCKLNIQEAEGRGSEVQFYYWLYLEFEGSPGYMGPFLKIKVKKQERDLLVKLAVFPMESILVPLCSGIRILGTSVFHSP